MGLPYMVQWSKAPDWEQKSKVEGSISVYASNFSTLDCKKNQHGALSQGNSSLQLPWTFMGDSLKGVDLALTSPESILRQIIIITPPKRAREDV